MKLFPYEKIEIESPLDYEGIRANLRSKVDGSSYNNRLNSMSFKEYHGTISKDEFVVARKSHLAINSVKPYAYGKFNESNSVIKVILRPHTYVVVFLAATSLFMILLFTLSLDTFF